MSGKIKYIVLIMACLAAAAYWMMGQFERSHAPIAPTKTPQAVASVQQEILNLPVSSVVKPSPEPQSKTLNNVQAIMPVPKSTKEDQTPVRAPSPLSRVQPDEQVLPDNKRSQPQVSDLPRVANPIPNDDELIASIALYNQKRDVTQKALQERKERIEQVHQAIITAGYSNEPKPFVAPLLIPPDDVAEKIKSHQVTAH